MTTDFEQDPSLVRRWGVADNGDVYEVALRPHLLDELRRRWPPVGLDRRTIPTGPVVARIGLSDAWVVVPDVEAAGDHPPSIAWDLLERSLAVFASLRLIGRIAVHSAVIGCEGRALLVPASSGGGKSTLTQAAAAAGAEVLSDEYALIDSNSGKVTGWNRPVRILKPTGEVERLDIATRSSPLVVGCVAFVSFLPGGGNRWAQISPGRAIGLLLSHVPCAESRPDEALDGALAALRSAQLLEGTRGEAASAVGELLTQTAPRHS
ncbi:MAG: hypothetical protein R2704_15590 [Microthrixaceae bacterium]